jgi:hypothetical protein
MGKRNGKKNGNKRRVSFNLSSDHTHRHSYTSVANSYQRRPTKQSWLQTFLLSGALILTLPKLVYRAAHVYCCTEDEPSQHLQKLGLCRVAKAAMDRYDKYVVPCNHFLFEIGLDKPKGPILHQGIDDTVSQRDRNAKNKGIFKRVVEKHRKQRAEKKEQRRESSEKQHTLHHLLEGASVFSHWKKKHTQQVVVEKTEDKPIQVDWSKWKYAMSDDFQLTPQQSSLIQELAKRVLLKSKLNKSMSAPSPPARPMEGDNSNTAVTTAVSTKSFSERVDSVAWGGVNSEVTRWWPRKDKNQNGKVSAQSEGARLLAAYLKIMKWPKV